VDGMSTDITDNVVPQFYDANGQVMDTTKLEMSVESVRISAQILNTKEVPLVLSTVGTPAEGYRLVSVSCNPTSVRVKGEAAVLNTLDKITIPPEVLDLTGVTDTVDKTIDMSTYLDKGVSLVISSDAKVDITAEIEPIETKEYKIPVNNITANGLKSGYQLSYSERYVLVSITAGKSAHNALNASEIKGTIDVADKGEGTHVVAVKFALDGEEYKAGAATTEIVVKAVGGSSGENNSESTESTEGGSENTGNGNTNGTEESTQAGATDSEKPGDVTSETTNTETVESETQKTSENTGE